MSGTISGQRTIGITLIAAAYVDPVTNIGTINLTAADVAISAPATWTLDNAGLIEDSA